MALATKEYPLLKTQVWIQPEVTKNAESKEPQAPLTRRRAARKQVPNV